MTFHLISSRIKQENSAMKVDKDDVLLNASTKPSSYTYQILDT